MTVNVTLSVLLIISQISDHLGPGATEPESSPLPALSDQLLWVPHMESILNIKYIKLTFLDILVNYYRLAVYTIQASPQLAGQNRL